MRTIREWLARLAGVFDKRDRDRDFSAELESHFQLHIKDNFHPRMMLQRSRCEALAPLGGVDQAKDKCRERRRLPWIEMFIQDVRFGLRVLKKNPGFTTIVVLTLALGIGANTAIFSLLNAVLLNVLPVRSPHELVLFSDFSAAGGMLGRQTGIWKQFSSDDYTYFTGHNHLFRELTAYQTNRINLNVRIGAAERDEGARCTMVAGNFFSFLGLKPAVGRLLRREDDQLSAAPVAVLNYGYWVNRFHSDPWIVGQTIEFNGVSFVIVGVAPRWFRGVNIHLTPDFWVTLARQPDVIPGRMFTREQNEYWLNIIGRIKPGVSMRRAEAAVNAQLKNVLYTRTERDGQTNEQIEDSHIQLLTGAYGISFLRERYGEPLKILSVIAGIVLLLVCANVAGLLLSRSAAREREISIRLAMGASRGRLVRQLLTESVLLSAIGGASGVLIAKWAAQTLVVSVAGTGLGQQIDARVLAFSIVISLGAGILFGLVPAVRAGRTDLVGSMKGSLNARMRLGFTNAIVLFQVAGSMVLLIAAGLFVRTFHKLADQSLGFDRDHILLVGIDPQKAGYQPADTSALYRALLERVEAIPGVRSATLDTDNPLGGNSWGSTFSIEDQPKRSDPDTILRKDLIGPHYFETEGIPILLGRDITLEDRAGMPMVSVINQTMARRYFGGENPIGKRFSLGAPFNPRESFMIVGVAADAHYYSLRGAVPPMEFAAALQVPDAQSHNASFVRDIAIRTYGDPRTIMAAVRPAVKDAAADLPVTNMMLMKDIVDNTLRQNRALAELSSGFGALTLLLACIGLYGTLAYRVSRRTQEIGVRVALGAQRPEVMWLVMREGLQMILLGIVVGTASAAASSKVIASELFGVERNDFVTYAAAAGLLVFVSLTACWIPAWRAMRVDPMATLRHE